MAKAKELPERFTFRFGSLYDAVDAKLKETGETPTEYTQRLMTTDLGVDRVDGRIENMRRLNENRKESAENGEGAASKIL